MKTLAVYLLLLSAILVIGCKPDRQSVLLGPGVSIEFPTDYKLNENPPWPDAKIFTASDLSDKMFAAVAPANGIDTINPDQLSSILEVNAQDFINPFNGEFIVLKDKQIYNTKVKEFQFEYSKNDSSFIVSGNVFTYDKNMYILSYETLSPMPNDAKKKIDEFFNSIKLN